MATALLLVSCGDHATPGAATPLAVEQPAFKIGDVDESGRLIFWSIDAFDHVEPFILSEDEYGVVLSNDGTEDRPVPGYILAVQSTREIVHTSDFAKFREALVAIPRGSAVGRYNTCSVSRDYGLPEAVKTQFETALSVAGLRVVDDRVVCYCPNR